VIKDWFKNSKAEDIHPSEEMFLRYVDGELSSRESGRVRSHLETCWSCRLGLEKIQETISAFVEFRQQIQLPLTEAPPRNWNDFNRKLNSFTITTPISRWSKYLSKIGRHFNFHAVFRSLSIGQRQTAFGTLAVLLVAVLIWQLVVVSPISASELLDRSLQMQAEQMGRVDQAVVYQKLRVRRNNVSEINWEVWRDTTRSRFRQRITTGVNAAFDQELLNVLRLNGFDAEQPLSATTFARWRKGLIKKSDNIERAKEPDGDEILVLHTVDQNSKNPGQISEATLSLRANDFHPVGEALKVNSPDGIQIYEFTELDYSVTSLSSFASDFFPEPVIPQTAAVSSPAPQKPPEANPATASNPNTAEKAAPVAFAPASADLEIEIFTLLNKAKADLGEQITVSRDPDGRLSVRGLVDTANRKNEILQNLAAVQNNPAVRIEIKTVDEAVSEQKSVPNRSGTTETVESHSSTAATDSELLSYFKSEEAARRFGGDMIDHSNQAMNRAYALKRLVDQLSTKDLRDLSPDGRSKLLTLVRAHATAFHEQCETLERELRPVFGTIKTGAAETPDVDDISALPRTIELLLTTASTNDQIVRSAFAVSSSGMGFSAIKTAQFWQSLKTAETLAMKLQSIK